MFMIMCQTSLIGLLDLDLLYCTHSSCVILHMENGGKETTQYEICVQQKLLTVHRAHS